LAKQVIAGKIRPGDIVTADRAGDELEFRTEVPGKK
jgi:hypothetical protein